MTKPVLIIGNGGLKIVEAILKSKGTNDVIIVDPLNPSELSGTSYPALKPREPFEIKPMPIIPEIKSGYKDGQTSRRNRRKRERKR